MVMNPEVLKQNYNYPFRTSEAYEWFVALDEGKVVGFVPVEHRKSEWIINNYYVREREADTLRLLLEQVVERWVDKSKLTAVCFLADRELFESFGFEEDKVWTRYVRMRKSE